MRAVLQALGFRVTSLSARVRWGRAPDNPETARSHMLLRVDMDDGPYLVDVGFGGYLLPAPIRMERGVEQPNAHGVVRLVGDDSSLILQAALPSGWQDLYRFTQEPSLEEDYVSANADVRFSHGICPNCYEKEVEPQLAQAGLSS